MSTHKNFDAICILVLAICLLITVLFMNGSRLGIEMVIDEDAEAHAGDVYFTSNDIHYLYDMKRTLIAISACLALCAAACSPYKNIDLQAHRGGAGLMPENR